MAATSSVTTASTVDTSNNSPMMEAIPSSSAMNSHTVSSTIADNTQQHDFITTHHYNGSNDSCSNINCNSIAHVDEVVKDDHNINTEGNGSLSVAVHDHDNRTVSPIQQSTTLQPTIPASEADRLIDVKYLESFTSVAPQPSLLFNPKNTTGSTAESQNDFNTMDILKEQLFQTNCTSEDDRLLNQIIQSTDEATSTDSNSIPIWDQLSFTHPATGSSAATTNGGYATLGFIHDQTTSATLSNRPRVLSSLSRQSSITTTMEISNNAAFDSFNMNSTSWKPMFQKSHQEIQYSPAHIFSDRKVGTVPTSKTGSDVTTSLALPPSIVPIVTSKADTPATDSISAAEAGTVPSAVHTAGAETLLLAAKVLHEEGTSQNDHASKSKSSRRKSRTPTAAALLSNEPGVASPQKGRSRMSKNQLAEFSAHGNVPEGHAIVDDGTGSRVAVLIPDADVTIHDVLLGRGGRTNHHEGNAKYRNYKESLQDEYLKATKDKKTSISNRLVNMIHQEQHGRFLKAYEPAKDQLNSDTKSKGKKCNASGTVEFWYEVDLLTARKKASQALREINTPENRAAKRAKYSK